MRIKKPLTAGQVFTVPPKSTTQDVRRKMTSYINHKFGGSGESRQFTDRIKKGEPEDEVIDTAFAYLNDRGKPYGLAFDLIELKETEMVYGWMPEGETPAWQNE